VPKENRGNRSAPGGDYAYMKQQEPYQQQNMPQQQQLWQQNQGQFPSRSQNGLMQQGDPSQPNATSRNRSNHSTLSFGDYSEALPQQQQQQRGYVATARSRNQEVGGRNGGVPPGSAAFQAPESLATYQARQQELRNQGSYQPSGDYGQQQMQQQQRQQHPYHQQQQVVCHQQQQQQYGGDGQVSFGAKPHGVARGSNSYANGANQNCGNVITDRSTTRIHAPPGGKSSFQLG
jgi:hypothetical protein